MPAGLVQKDNRRTDMVVPEQAFRKIYGKIKREWKVAFLTCFFLGLLIHMPMLASDIPNHDGLDSMYFDQNMITSGRWFLMVACGFSSFYTVPWVIGILGLVFLGCTAAALCELLEVRKTWAVVLCSGLLVSFPALASTFAYVFTLDGYMLAMLLAVLAVLFTEKFRRGFLPGAVCLAFSMGIYQAYLSFAIILSVFAILKLFAKEDAGGPEAAGNSRRKAAGKDTGEPEAAGNRRGKAPGKVMGSMPISGNRPARGKFLEALHYLYMGVLGAGLYVVILQVLLKIEGKELADYQGINGMLSGNAQRNGIFAAVAGMYRDFLGFTFKGNVLFQNIFSLTACILLAAAAVLFLAMNRKYWKNLLLLVIIVVAVLILPIATNIILLISPSVTYHLLMRYQWVLYIIGAVAMVGGHSAGTKAGVWLEWAVCLAAFVLVFCYGVTDNIAYSNLQKKYEKTYAYCVRLLDRIEQTEGYYPGIPIAMIGVVGDEQYPPTDITLPVTSNMIGMCGDSLLYRGDNYEAFIMHYLGATLNILPAGAMEEMYYSEEYIAMDSFPGKDSIRIMDGIMYIKTENVTR